MVDYECLAPSILWMLSWVYPKSPSRRNTYQSWPSQPWMGGHTLYQLPLLAKLSIMNTLQQLSDQRESWRIVPSSITQGLPFLWKGNGKLGNYTQWPWKSVRERLRMCNLPVCFPPTKNWKSGSYFDLYFLVLKLKIQ